MAVVGAENYDVAVAAADDDEDGGVGDGVDVETLMLMKILLKLRVPQSAVVVVGADDEGVDVVADIDAANDEDADVVVGVVGLAGYVGSGKPDVLCLQGLLLLQLQHSYAFDVVESVRYYDLNMVVAGF